MTQSPAALLVQSLANTLDVENDTDELATRAALADWLRAHHLATTAPTARELSTWRTVRDGLREALTHPAPERTRWHVLAAADTALRTVPMLLTLTGTDRDTPLVPDPALTPAMRALGVVAAAWTTTATTGELVRMRCCANPDCAWVFWDNSRNRTRRWCSMRICGNRAKARTHAAARH
jgi:predicted RNA-binding Zn ribbon-like protein